MRLRHTVEEVVHRFAEYPHRCDYDLKVVGVDNWLFVGKLVSSEKLWLMAKSLPGDATWRCLQTVTGSHQASEISTFRDATRCHAQTPLCSIDPTFLLTLSRSGPTTAVSVRHHRTLNPSREHAPSRCLCRAEELQFDTASELRENWNIQTISNQKSFIARKGAKSLAKSLELNRKF